VTFKQDLALYDQDTYYEEPILDDDTYCEANEVYKRTTRQLKNQISHLSQQMNPRHAMVAKALVTGKFTNKQIAHRLRYSPATITGIKRDPLVRKLMSCIQKLRELEEGTKAIDREMFLWAIALENQELDARVSIAAVAEINRMRTDTQAQQAKLKSDQTLAQQPQVIIQLADPRLTASPLDELPPTMKDVN